MVAAWIIGLLCLSFAVFFISRQLPLLLPRSFYELVAEPEPGDMIVLLGGGLRQRVPKAVELFKSGVANSILITGADKSQNKALKTQLGNSSVIVEPAATSTMENAVFSIKMMEQRQNPPQRVLLVTDWWHTRRAVACFHDAAPDLEFLAVAPDPETVKWINEEEARRREFGALLWYVIRYRIRPWKTR